jgi:hypothetical protein
MGGDFKVPDIDCAEAPAETLIYERQPGETCSCARLNAREGAALTYCCSRCPPAAPSSPATMLDEAFEHIRKARRIVAEMEGRALRPQVAADLGVANLKGREMAEHVGRALRATSAEEAKP